MIEGDRTVPSFTDEFSVMLDLDFWLSVILNKKAVRGTRTPTLSVQASARPSSYNDCAVSGIPGRGLVG